LAVSVCRSPVWVSRHSTPVARRLAPDPVVRIRVANAFATSRTFLPPFDHASAVRHIGTYELSVERLAFRLRCALRGWTHPWKQKPQNVQPVACGYVSRSESCVLPAVPPGWRIAFSCGRKPGRTASL